MSEPLFRVDNLRLSLPDMTRKPLFGAAPRIEILRGLSFDIPAGSTIGIVGESGSGKSTLGRAMVRLHEPTEGAIRFDGQDITHLSNTALLPLRRDLQVIFQDPYSSLNPRKSIGAIIGAPLLFHNVASDSADAGARAAAALHAVGLPSAFAVRYPHELSGGQRQRVGIARALALEPEILIADEAVSALDVSVQYQVLQLLREVQSRRSLAILFVTHDLRVAAQMCDRIAVMRRGELVELKETSELLASPEQQYTRELLAAIPGHELVHSGTALRIGNPALAGA
jgi:ABC-type oligopeptide transport system ATPase subunit